MTETERNWKWVTDEKIEDLIAFVCSEYADKKIDSRTADELILRLKEIRDQGVNA